MIPARGEKPFSVGISTMQTIKNGPDFEILVSQPQ